MINISTNPVKENSLNIIVISSRAVRNLLKYPTAFARKMFGVLFTLADPFNLVNRINIKVRRICFTLIEAQHSMLPLVKRYL